MHHWEEYFQFYFFCIGKSVCWMFSKLVVKYGCVECLVSWVCAVWVCLCSEWVSNKNSFFPFWSGWQNTTCTKTLIIMQDQWNFTSWQKFRSLHTSAKEERWRYAVVAHGFNLTSLLQLKDSPKLLESVCSWLDALSQQIYIGHSEPAPPTMQDGWYMWTENTFSLHEPVP